MLQEVRILPNAVNSSRSSGLAGAEEISHQAPELQIARQTAMANVVYTT